MSMRGSIGDVDTVNDMRIQYSTYSTIHSEEYIKLLLKKIRKCKKEPPPPPTTTEYLVNRARLTLNTVNFYSVCVFFYESER